MSRIAVIVPAAGSGSRMGGEVPKQFRPLGGAPVLVQTLRAFAGHTLVVAVSEGEVGEVERLLREHHLDAMVVAGGDTRQASVGRGLDAVAEGMEGVLVHDAVRPFISADRIAAAAEAVRAHGAAALAVPVADTLRRSAEDRFGATVERAGLYRMQTPQGARPDLLRAAHEAARLDGFVGTDEVELLQRVGVAVQLVPGDARNLKLTHPADWALAEALWDRWTVGGGQ